jgi:hypothetical protein
MWTPAVVGEEKKQVHFCCRHSTGAQLINEKHGPAHCRGTECCFVGRNTTRATPPWPLWWPAEDLRLRAMTFVQAMSHIPRCCKHEHEHPYHPQITIKTGAYPRGIRASNIEIRTGPHGPSPRPDHNGREFHAAPPGSKDSGHSIIDKF